MDEKVLVLCEKSLLKFSSNLYVLRPPQPEKRLLKIEELIESINVNFAFDVLCPLHTNC